MDSEKYNDTAKGICAYLIGEAIVPQKMPASYG